MKRPANEAVTPPGGGWKYLDPITGVPFASSSLMVLLQQVRAQRQANGIAIESGWEIVVLDELCGQNPAIECIDVENPEIPMTGDDVRRFLLTLQEQVGHDLVSEEEHARRADICLTCPKLGYVSCVFPCGWVTRMLTELLGNRRIHRPAEFHKRGCKSCGCQIDAKTYYPVNVLKAVDQKLGKQPDYWEHCWMREGL